MKDSISHFSPRALLNFQFKLLVQLEIGNQRLILPLYTFLLAFILNTVCTFVPSFQRGCIRTGAGSQKGNKHNQMCGLFVIFEQVRAPQSEKEMS